MLQLRTNENQEILWKFPSLYASSKVQKDVSAAKWLPNGCLLCYASSARITLVLITAFGAVAAREFSRRGAAPFLRSKIKYVLREDAAEASSTNISRNS